MGYSYTNSIEDDFGGAFCMDNWVAEIRASSITVALDYATRNDDQLLTVFKEMLVGANLTTFNGLPAKHDPTPVTPTSKVQIIQRSTGPKTLIHGVSRSAGPEEWVCLNCQFPVPVHIQKVRIRWLDALEGDYGFLVVIHPLGDTSPQEAVAEGSTTVVLPSSEVATVYASAMAMEFWDAAGDVLVERHRVASVDEATVTLATPVNQAHATDANLKAMLDTYSPCLGGSNVTAGYRMIGDDHDEINSETEITPAIPAGLILGTRFCMSSENGTRKLSVNYRLRMCDGGECCGL